LLPHKLHELKLLEQKLQYLKSVEMVIPLQAEHSPCSNVGGAVCIILLQVSHVVGGIVEIEFVLPIIV